ncbi:MAG: cytochrome C biosynthesis protein [Sphingomicrobium sp.]
MLKLAAAALLLGACGYALQGRPGLTGDPRRAGAGSEVLPLAQARHIFFGEFSPDEHWMLMSEAVSRDGDAAAAAVLLRSAVREHPGDPMLWIGLGNALVDHAHVMTPPAELAYARAEQLAPGHPAAPFFRGLALARSGDAVQAVGIWRDLLAKAPANAGWRPLVEDGIATLTPAAERQKRMRSSQQP